jgi:hypothetical protein
MGFTKGDKNINRMGRPVGSKNKLYSSRRFILNTLEDNRDKLIHELKELKGEKFVQYYIRLLEFVLAKRNNQILDVEKLSEKEVKDLIDSIN